MSMNFGREMSLLRIRLTEAGSPEKAAERQAATGSAATFLGADDAEMTAAANDLVENFPQMGRAQMTAFVRTLWQSNTHELMTVGSRILAARATLLEPADLPFVEGLLKKCDVDAVAEICRDTPVAVIFVSGYQDKMNRTRADQPYVRGYLLKPVKRADLEAAIRALSD